MTPEELQRRLDVMSEGRKEWIRRMCLYLLAAKKKDWPKARKWAMLADRLDSYKAARRLAARGFEI